MKKQKGSEFMIGLTVGLLVSMIVSKFITIDHCNIIGDGLMCHKTHGDLVYDLTLRAGNINNDNLISTK